MCMHGTGIYLPTSSSRADVQWNRRDQWARFGSGCVGWEACSAGSMSYWRTLGGGRGGEKNSYVSHMYNCVPYRDSQTHA